MEEQVGWSEETIASSRMLTLFSAVRSLLCECQKKYGPLTPLTNSKLEFVSAKTAAWSCILNSDSLANFAMPTDFYFFACTPEATCEFIPIQ